MFQFNTKKILHQEMNLGAYFILGVIELPLLYFFGIGAREALRIHCESSSITQQPLCWPQNYYHFFLILISLLLIFSTYIAAVITKSERYRRIFIWANFGILIASFFVLPYFLG